MEEKKKTNYWKIASIILLIFIVGFLVNHEIERRQTKILSIGGMNISDKDLNSFIKVAEGENWNQFTITNLETNKSITLKRSKLDKTNN